MRLFRMAATIAGSYLYPVKAADFNQDHWPDRVLREISSTVPGFFVPLACSSTKGVIMPG